MAKRNEKEFNQNFNEIQSIIEKYVPGGVEAQALLLHEINKSINKDDIGRVYLNQYALAMRRLSISKSFKGDNIKELSEKFDVSEQTIRNDVKEHYATQIKKSKVKGLNFIGIRKSLECQE
jgi:hypothetical protein